MISSPRSRFGCGFQVQSLVMVVFFKRIVQSLVMAYSHPQSSISGCHFLGRFQLGRLEMGDTVQR
ncbi:RHOMBOID-like protein 3 [Zea mays]|uniref:RHOMBOID-like protein 3 n=1 Tax=Zea mays TaxID=4577 RepID=A0A1D6QJE4_MAIZE|nr:RHOMBOID-like protein 3 [Zea mays]